uniref:Mobile element protein n=1 Tax=Parastrongyloides trichosuri TaxID=131310 RepID=A0A0N5A683_PARTI
AGCCRWAPGSEPVADRRRRTHRRAGRPSGPRRCAAPGPRPHGSSPRPAAGPWTRRVRGPP